MDMEKAADLLARRISQLTHPFLVSPVLGLGILLSYGLTALQAVYWIFISLAVTIIPITLYIHLSPEYSSFNPSQEKRKKLYLIGTTQLVVLGALFAVLDAPGILTSFLTVAVTTVLIGALVNRITKISIHTGVMSGFSTSYLFTSTRIAALLFLLTTLTGWSRIHQDHHTVSQTLLGLIIPTLVISAGAVLSPHL